MKNKIYCMHKLSIFLIVICFSIFYANAQSIVYVSPTGTGNGTSWAQATDITSALASANNNTDIWLKEGSYLINSTLIVGSDNLSLYGGFVGTETSLNQRNWQNNLTTFDGQNSTKIMRINADDCILDGITFTNGFVTGSISTTNDGGGALRLAGDNTLVINCKFTNNTSQAERGGGAIFMWHGNNHTIDNCIFENNSNTNASGNGGGAIHNWDDNVTFRNTSFINNFSSTPGGALYTWTQDVLIENCIFEDNESNSYGGAIHSRSILSILNTEFTNNTSMGRGGAIDNGNVLYVVNNLFDGNSSQNSYGGAIFNGKEIHITNATFTNNSDTALAHNANTACSTTIYNSIFYNNQAYSSFPYSDIAPTNTTDNSVKDFQNNILEGNPNGTNNSIGVNPLFIDPTNSNYELQSSSPAIDIGSNALYNNISTIAINSATDLSGDTRVFNTIVDLGAYEYNTPITCTNIASPLNADTNVTVNTNITWNAVADADGYSISLGTSAGANDILNNLDVGNTTSYTPANSFPQNTTIFVSIIPYNSAGNASACTEESFTTETIIIPPNCTNIASPLNADTNVAVNTGITWNAVADADGYSISLGTSAGANDIVNNLDVGNTTSYTPANSFPQNTTIFVSIIPYNSAGNASTCTEESFTTEILITPPNCTTIANPLNADTNVAVNTNITWNAVANADGYSISLGTSAGANDILNNLDVGNTTSYTPANSFPQNTTIFVSIIPYNSSGNASACAEESFTTETIIIPPNCTNIASPLNADTNVAVNTSITWNAVADADGYSISLGTSVGANNILNNLDVGNTTTYTPANSFPQNTTIFVNIIPYNSAGNASTCTEESFTTETIITPPNCTTIANPLNADTNVAVNTNITWNAVANADGYSISLGTSAGANDILNNLDVGNTTSYTPANSFPQNTTIFVSIIPYNSAGNASACTEESFTTETIIIPPNCTNIASPLNADTNVAVNTGITWNAVADADGYSISLGTSAGANDIVNNLDVGNTTSYTPANSFPQNTTIFVSIIPYNSTENAIACTEESFTTETIITPPIDKNTLIIPNFFTPNNDGINDLFKIIDKENIVKEFIIFDRFGKILYSGKTSYNLIWDGNYNGKKMPANDYWLKLVLKSGEVITKNISLLR
ncbi:T9SS type B sorting domain-containing protein [Mesonia hippocampi]|uniref:T9SS type B sorting domain-containing protein n=1 Tax=Mesonia hippocampi TaxID=1628250 RepID=UPI003F9438F9